MKEQEAAERLGNMRFFAGKENAKAFKVAIHVLEEIQLYRSIGTIEECQEAREKRRAKKPETKIQNEDVKVGHVTFKAGTKTYWCPSCKKAITGSDHYCRWCGQAIDF